MKIKLSAILDAMNAFRKLSDAELSLGTAYKLKRFTDEIQKELAFFDERRFAMVDKHGKFDTNGAFVPTDAAHNIAFAGEFNELLRLEVEPSVEQFTLPPGENVKLSVNDINALEPFIIFEQ
jgi:hypothetical protein